MKEPARHTVTAALPYANGPLHIGHIAGAYLPADIYVRNLRQRGKEVLFICGSDEHGAAITIRAMKEGTTPRAIVDTYHALMGQAFQDFGIHFDIYHRTSSELHTWEACLWNKATVPCSLSGRVCDLGKYCQLIMGWLMGNCGLNVAAPPRS